MRRPFQLFGVTRRDGFLNLSQECRIFREKDGGDVSQQFVIAPDAVQYRSAIDKSWLMAVLKPRRGLHLTSSSAARTAFFTFFGTGIPVLSCPARWSS
jgi:hypothetical protein